MKRTHWLLTLKAAIGVALFVMLYRVAGARGMFATLANAHAPDFLTACGLMVVALAFNAWRWWVVMKSITQPISLRAALTATFESIFFQQVVPAGIGGDISRGVRAYDTGVSTQGAFIGVVIDRGIGLLFVGVTIAAAAAVAQSSLIGTRAFSVVFLTSAGILAGAACAVLIGACRMPRWLPNRAAPIVALLRAFSRCMRAPRFLFRVSLLLVCSNVAYIASFFFCALALDVHMGMWDAAIVIQGMVLVSVLPISVGGWGLRESAAIVLCAPLGVDAAHSMAVSVLFGLVLTVLGGFGAIIWMTSAYRRILSSPADVADVGEVRWDGLPASAAVIDGKATQA
jgi:glycosyltransferase 2 family protein